MIYHLDLETLLLMLGQGNGILYADVRQTLKTRENRHAHIELHNGSITVCLIQDDLGRVLFTNENALRMIQSQVLQWHFEAKPSTSSSANLLAIQESRPERAEIPPTSPSLSLLSSHPQRTHPVTQDELLMWPRLHRAIFSLATGSTTVERIESMLAHDPRGRDDVRRALEDLIKRGFVHLEQAKG